jgi:hypothetical protein
LKAFANGDLAQGHFLLVVHAHVVKVVGVGFAIVGATDDELVEVVIPPAERRLDDMVQVTQGSVTGDQEPPPDGRLAAFQCDLDLKGKCV